MKEVTRTLMFVAAAAICAGAAAIAHFSSQPEPLAEFEKVGTEFYPEFVDPNEARSLKVVAVDEDTLTAKEFAVEFRDGIWRIPSHHNYPADAEDRLAETAASVIGITRGALASRRERDHERFGVLAPLADTATSGLKGRGQRITISREDGTTLVDLIVGKPVAGRDGYYYIRRPNEKETYITNQEIKLSAKFTDWIESDLLQLDRDQLTRIDMTEPVVNAQTRQVDETTSTLTRADSTAEWQLTGLDEKTEELNTEKVQEVVTLLDDLEIVGIRPKPEGLTADLAVEVPAQAQKNPALIQAIVRSLQADLRSLGFQVGYDSNEQPRIYSMEGEVVASTSQGVKYYLHFGDLFTGSQEEIEFGSSGEAEPTEDPADEDKDGQAESDEARPAAGPAEDGAEAEEAATEAGADGESDDAGQPGRYVFVRVAFDETAIGERPVAPEKPAALQAAEAAKPADGEGASNQDSPETPPADDTPGEEDQPAEEKDGTEKADDAESAGEAKADTAAADSADESKDEKKDPAAPAATGDEPPKPAEPAQPDLKQLQADYDRQLAQYRDQLRQFEDKVKQGKEQVDSLNERFADWYYVISAESFRNLRLKRSELVREKKAEPAGAPAAPGGDAAAPAGAPAGAAGAPATTPRSPVEAPVPSAAPAPATPPAD